MIEPPVRLAAMRRAASWPTRNTPSRLTLITSRHSSSVVLVKKAPEGMPALLTRMVIGPSAASASAKAFATEARSVTSMATAAASAAAGPNLGLELFQDIEPPRRQRHLGAGLGQHAREMAAEAGGGPRHQRGLAVEGKELCRRHPLAFLAQSVPAPCRTLRLWRRMA